MASGRSVVSARLPHGMSKEYRFTVLHKNTHHSNGSEFTILVQMVIGDVGQYLIGVLRCRDGRPPWLAKIGAAQQMTDCTTHTSSTLQMQQYCKSMIALKKHKASHDMMDSLKARLMTPPASEGSLGFRV